MKGTQRTGPEWNALLLGASALHIDELPLFNFRSRSLAPTLTAIERLRSDGRNGGDDNDVVIVYLIIN